MSTVGLSEQFSFADLQVLGHSKPPQAEDLREAVQQFESLFVNMMLKSMREATASLNQDGYLNSSEIQAHQQMLDQQLSVSLSQSGGIGLAEPLMRQLAGGLGYSEPALGTRVLTRPAQTPPAVHRQVAINHEPPTSVFATPQEFVRRLLPTFEAALSDTPIDPTTALAQAALETGWGAHTQHTATGEPSHNLFGIKATHWQGATVSADTLEFVQGQPITKTEQFRAYDNWGDSIVDYARLIGGSDRYSQAVKHAGEPESYLRELQSAGYATDPSYADKILGVLQQVKQLLR